MLDMNIRLIKYLVSSKIKLNLELFLKIGKLARNFLAAMKKLRRDFSPWAKQATLVQLLQQRRSLYSVATQLLMERLGL